SRLGETLQPPYEVLAIRYATHANRVARENFLRPERPDAPMPIDYFVWAIRGHPGTSTPGVIVIDTGMSNDAASRRPGRIVLTTVDRALANAAIDPIQVEDVVITHMHYDHAGRLDLFP